VGREACREVLLAAPVRAWQDPRVPTWRFGVFELDDEGGELRKAGRRVPIAGQPVKVLALLVRRSGRVVTREELRRTLWGDETTVSFDQGLNFCVRRIRLALGDDARSPRYLETLPRRGYRLLADASPVGAPVGAQPAATPQAEEAAFAVTHVVARAVRTIGGLRLPGVRVAAALALVVLAGQKPGPAATHTRSTAIPAALAAFERGQSEWAAGAEGRRRSVARFREAARLDPRFAEARYALADAYLTLGERGELPLEPAFAEARQSAEAAVALEDVAMTRLVLATVRAVHDWDWAGAGREYDRALLLAPSSDAVLTSYARFLSATGRHEDAVRAIDRAEAASPGCDLVLHESGWVHYRARRYDEAVRKLEAAIAQGPPRGSDAAEWTKLNRFRILLVHWREGAFPAADEDARAVLRLVPGAREPAEPVGAASRETVAWFLRGSLAFLARRAEHEAVPPVRYAELHAALGEDERALAWLERGARERHPTVAWSLYDPLLDGLRAHPGFRRLARQLGQPGAASGTLDDVTVADARPLAAGLPVRP
jgi:DNA-binding winged helix-turn-helix (wHTH) protein/tetratricopeptide (TPR) repeat protein